MKRIERQIGTATALAAITATGANAALIGSTLDTFSSGSTIPTSYTPLEYQPDGDPAPPTIPSVLSLATGGLSGGDDRDKLDDANDGYLLVQQQTGGRSIGFIRDLGVIDAADVGKIIEIDVAYELVSATLNTFYNIQLVDGGVATPIGDNVSISFFGSGNDTGAATGLYSGVIGSKFSYTVLAGDIGKTAEFVHSGFASGNSSRQLGVDAVSIEVVPEPASVALLATGALFCMRRRRA